MQVSSGWVANGPCHGYDDGMTANETVQEKLTRELDATHVEIIDNSWMHAGHVAMKGISATEGTHLRVIVVSERFNEVNLIDRHRMVYQALASEFAKQLHALEIKTFTPAEYQNASF